jgi:ssDNA-binding Zn-finger/Zn-ribbon topoisomerase 1
MDAPKLTCPDCGANLILREGKYGKFYGCVRYPQCTGAHGIHQATGEPLGIPANQETRKMRIAAHEAFDKLWKSTLWKGILKKVEGNRRKQVYEWLRKQMGLTENECHIGNFNIEQCKEVIRICKNINLRGK